jgi:hypothetical protein
LFSLERTTERTFYYQSLNEKKMTAISDCHFN